MKKGSEFVRLLLTTAALGCLAAGAASAEPYRTTSVEIKLAFEICYESLGRKVKQQIRERLIRRHSLWNRNHRSLSKYLGFLWLAGEE